MSLLSGGPISRHTTPNALSEERKPQLSICIPTYNRANWLRLTLEHLVPQLKEAAGQAELVISDNASTDHTAEVVARAQQDYPVRYRRNERNIGAEPNMYLLVSELATGDFTWILGDDDFLRPGAVAQVLSAILKNPDLDYLYVNYQVWDCASPPPPHTPLPPADQLKSGMDDWRSRRLDSLAEIAGGDPNCFTPISCSIMRREMAPTAIYRDPEQPAFSCAQSVVPHAMFVAREQLVKPAYYLGEPLTVLATGSTWKKYECAFLLRVLPELYDTLESHGAARPAVQALRRRVAAAHSDSLYGMLFVRDTAAREYFSLRRYLWQHRSTPQAWVALGNAIWRRAVDLLCAYRVTRFVYHRCWLIRNSLRRGRGAGAMEAMEIKAGASIR